jgi:hypothetical protein
VASHFSPSALVRNTFIYKKKKKEEELDPFSLDFFFLGNNSLNSTL